ncbi:GNAT superfamily N-acetyltransferase [Chromobacterium alkanivorans]|uniref:GNAT family N-acetyltransferase n=1 Tax=Chromobacterium alkanivorans TaxID=1071719 RepID=UPI00216998E5|nr:GNAT family N-acetyltransferase [Chromobacterium alkanivorans]MCS3804195.1 GNAT superfamily N-acetyltransferase [Chromobacterium alkanivorans]MCS3818585.1 GNAT superfamily N-acetyltransferase [Chromobacterium alkanivorans]MCS3873480.1 GNAT superfamily N-acetyltransferase [Chromobacterium alkanivorans]
MAEAVFSIRPLQAGDHAGWLPLWRDYNAFYGRAGATALPEEVDRETWRRLLAPAEPVHGLAAVADGALLGIAHLLYHRNTIQIQDSAYLQDLYVAPAARGGGVARALLRAAAERARADGAATLYWRTASDNLVARRLYDQVAELADAVIYRQVL